MIRSTTMRRLGPRFATGLLMASLALGTVGATSASAVTGYSTETPMILFNVPPEDLMANRHGICNGKFQIVVRTAGGVAGAIRFLDAAQHCGLKAILFFSDTANHSTGKVYPSRVAALVNGVKNHPALYGYLTVKEPSWIHISGAEIRSLYRAFKAADPSHPVVALFGDIPHFGEQGQSVHREHGRHRHGRLVSGRDGQQRLLADAATHYITTGPKWLTKVRAKIAAVTPGTPIWLMIQTHKYLAPSCHKKQRPTEAQMRRQVRDGLAYAEGHGHRVPHLPEHQLLHATCIATRRWSAGCKTDQRSGPRRHLPLRASRAASGHEAALAHPNLNAEPVPPLGVFVRPTRAQ